MKRDLVEQAGPGTGRCWSSWLSRDSNGSGRAVFRGVVLGSLVGLLAGCAGGADGGGSDGGGADAGAGSSLAPSSASTPASSASAPASRTPSDHLGAPPPVLGSSTTSTTKGYGSVRPAEIDGGRDSSGLVSDVRWSSWGEAQATGTGTALYVAPDQANAQGTREKATVVAFELGQCDGRPAYLKLTWFFPQHGDKLNVTGALDTCDI